MIPKESKVYPQLNDQSWLYQRYVVEGISTEKIAKEINCKSCASVSKALRWHGIGVRTKSGGHLATRGQTDFVFHKDILEGCLLGDGCLASGNPASDDILPSFRQKSIRRDHIEFLAQSLYPISWEGRVKSLPNNMGYNAGKEASVIFDFAGVVEPSLLTLYRAWYPPERNWKKRIPGSIEVTPRVLLHWLLDDAYVFQRRGKYRHKKQVCINFAANDFVQEDLEMLKSKVWDALGLKVSLRYHQRHGRTGGTGWEVEVPQSQTPLFYEIIGECPVPSLAYKWK